MGKGVEFVGKVSEAGFPSVVFGSDTKSVSGADGGGTVGTFVGGGRHCNRAARDQTLLSSSQDKHTPQLDLSEFFFRECEVS